MIPDEWRLDKLVKIKSFGDKRAFRQRVCKLAEEGDWLEFGVYQGESANIFLTYGVKNNSKLYLFDSWEGLPEAWTGHNSDPKGLFEAGAMKCEMPIFNDERVVIVKGLFNETLPEWASTFQGKIGLVHIDSDIYSSCKTVLKYIHPLITKDTLIIFDEFCGYPSWKEHEYKAFKEYVKRWGLRYKFIARSDSYAQVALKVWR